MTRPAYVARSAPPVPLFDRGVPIAGLYAVRWRLNAAEIALAITYEPTHDPDTGERLDRSYYWLVDLNGASIWSDLTPPSADGLLFRTVRPIDQAEYAFLVADRAWAKQFAADSPEAEPTRKRDLLTEAPVF